MGLIIFPNTHQASVGRVFALSLAILPLIGQKNEIKIIFQTFRIEMLGTAHVKIQNGMLNPILLIVCDGKPLEEIFPSLEIAKQIRNKLSTHYSCTSSEAPLF